MYLHTFVNIHTILANAACNQHAYGPLTLTIASVHKHPIVCVQLQI